jgi:dihydrofolate reductase
MEITLIAAIDNNRAIGFDNKLPWHLPDDLKFFKAQTQGGVVVMGRKTFESLGCRPLPNRRNIVLTRQVDWHHEGVEVATDWQALKMMLNQEGVQVVWVIGGGEIYATCIYDATQLVLTQVDTQLPNADAWFPEWSSDQWRLVSQIPHVTDDKHCFAFAWQTWTSI